MPKNLDKVVGAYETILDEIYPDWRDDCNTEGTPKRAAKAIFEVTDGYGYDDSKINTTFEEEEHDQIVAVKNIGYFTLCAHHMFPFMGKVNIAYIPDKKVLGLSKFARIVRKYSRRLQIQERMTDEIANEIEKVLQPRAVAVYATGAHLCMAMRGIESENAVTETSAMRGLFMEDDSAKAEVMAIFSRDAKL